MTAPNLQTAGTEIQSGIHTSWDPEKEPRGFRVTWIDWNSDFRRNLRLNDVITSVNGHSVEPLMARGKQHAAIGQTQETQYFQQMGVSGHQEVVLRVIRGAEQLDVTGTLDTDYFYYDQAGKPALAPGGPPRLGNDSSGDTWMIWFEKFINRTSHNLTMGWTVRSFNNRNEIQWYLDQKPRIDLLQSKYPGPFADALHEDWQRAIDLASGKTAELGERELEYRAIGVKRVQIAKAEAGRAWDAARLELATDTIPAFPAPTPFERKEMIGKIVELPPLTPRNFRNDLGKAFIVAGSRHEGYYFILFTQQSYREYYEVLRRYSGQVNPKITERVRFLVRILDEPQIFTVDDRPVTGMATEPVFALAGEDEMFTDLRHSPPVFAGEASLASLLSLPRDDTSPRSVIEAMIFAVKTGDEKTWLDLFAQWRVVSGSGGRTIIDPSYVDNARMLLPEWDRSRRLIMGDVYDARVDYVDEVRRILTRDEVNGIPNVDQVVVWIDHYGLFDAEYRTFQNINVNRRWVLQRLDEGPWKIVSAQHL